MSLVTTSELSTFTQLSIPAGTATTEAQAACDRATALVRAFCRRKITQTTETETRAVVVDEIQPSETPVQSVTSITIASTAVTGYTVRADGSIVLPSTYAQGTTADIVYVSGYAATDWRVEAARAVAVRVAARLWTNPDSRTSYTGPEALTYTSTPDLVRLLTADERVMLGPLVRMDVIG